MDGPHAFAVVVNDGAGRGLAARAWPRLEAAMRARGLKYEVIRTRSADEACARVRALPPDVAVLVAGGDGTVHGVLPAFVGTGRALGIVPLGSGNDFAGLLGLRSGDVDAALDRVTRAARAVDLLEARTPLGTHHLLNGLGMGFDAQVSALMKRAPARLSGFGRYFWAVLAGLRDLRTGQVRVHVDGREVYVGPSCLVAVMNGVRYGGGFRISPTSDVQDGQLNVVLGRALTRVTLLALLTKVLRGTHLHDARVVHGHGREVQVTWAQPMHAHVDGELAGEVTALHARILPGALQLLSLPH
ncbi:diacylglycerol kinase catalytic region [Deinococcus maricopensis DSM 21211]|uniref:Diacylglycerol kinase catalytic region n=1 Tax=Deinococcus maricopensis (strain DSM 21211 / LMG 22137 / NRRL B-23946 / LB-34) TaxID=709986 RepID=E8U781_DEIML|nr:diacylglycerol kinase catalytic region [Deinococcus maricopensis DSM 21211]